jgi:hypothetical protein
MPSFRLPALGCLLAGGCALLFGQWSLSESRDLIGLYWLMTGAVMLRASLGLAQKLAP